MLIWNIKAKIQEYRLCRAAEAGYAVESLLASDPYLIKEVWIRMRGCYKDAIDHPLPPSRVATDQIMAE